MKGVNGLGGRARHLTKKRGGHWEGKGYATFWWSQRKRKNESRDSAAKENRRRRKELFCFGEEGVWTQKGEGVTGASCRRRPSCSDEKNSGGRRRDGGSPAGGKKGSTSSVEGERREELAGKGRRASGTNKKKSPTISQRSSRREKIHGDEWTRRVTEDAPLYLRMLEGKGGPGGQRLVRTEKMPREGKKEGKL